MSKNPQEEQGTWLRAKIKNTFAYKYAQFRNSCSNYMKKQLALQNPVYKALDHERNNKNVLDILKAQLEKQIPGKKKKKHNFIRTNKSLSLPRSVSVDYYFNKNQLYLQRNSFKKRAKSILSSTQDISQFLVKKQKNDLKILDDYNNLMNRYYKCLPKDYESKQNDSFVNNQHLIQINKEYQYSTQHLHKKARSLMLYKQPQLKQKKIKDIKEKCRTTWSLDKGNFKKKITSSKAPFF